MNDQKFYLEVPDEGFSPEKNKAIVENSIKKYELKRAKMKKEAVEFYRERADASASWLRVRSKGYNGGLDRYFGLNMLAHLRGDQILAELKIAIAKAKNA